MVFPKSGVDFNDIFNSEEMHNYVVEIVQEMDANYIEDAESENSRENDFSLESEEQKPKKKTKRI